MKLLCTSCRSVPVYVVNYLATLHYPPADYLWFAVSFYLSLLIHSQLALDLTKHFSSYIKIINLVHERKKCLSTKTNYDTWSGTIVSMSHHQSALSPCWFSPPWLLGTSSHLLPYTNTKMLTKYWNNISFQSYNSKFWKCFYIYEDRRSSGPAILKQKRWYQ